MFAQVETVATDASPGADVIRADGSEPWSGDAIGGDASTFGPLGAHLHLLVCCPGLSLLGDVVPGDTVSTPGSIGVVDPGAT
jgi:hypothetical protein